MSTVRFVAIINANNFPVYFYSVDASQTLKGQGLAEMALDFVDTQFTRGSSTYSLLLVHDGIAVYGQLTNTNIKIFIGADAHASDGPADLDSVFKNVQTAYIQHICNPFNNVDQQLIKSTKFDSKIASLVAPPPPVVAEAEARASASTSS